MIERGVVKYVKKNMIKLCLQQLFRTQISGMQPTGRPTFNANLASYDRVWYNARIPPAPQPTSELLTPVLRVAYATRIAAGRAGVSNPRRRAVRLECR